MVVLVSPNQTARTASRRRRRRSEAREALEHLCQWGLSDVFREKYSADKIYSWWDYRAGDFHQGRGMRIDLVLASASVAARTSYCVIDRNARKGQQPSDHAPVVIDIDPR